MSTPLAQGVPLSLKHPTEFLLHAELHRGYLIGPLYICHLVYICSCFVAFRAEFLTPGTLISDKSVQVGMKKLALDGL